MVGLGSKNGAKMQKKKLQTHTIEKLRGGRAEQNHKISFISRWEMALGYDHRLYIKTDSFRLAKRTESVQQ